MGNRYDAGKFRYMVGSAHWLFHQQASPANERSIFVLIRRTFMARRATRVWRATSPLYWFFAVSAAVWGCLPPSPPARIYQSDKLPWEQEPCLSRHSDNRIVFSAMICVFSDPTKLPSYESADEVDRILLKQRRNLRRQGLMPALSCDHPLVSQMSECIPVVMWHTVDGHFIRSDSDLDKEIACRRLNRQIVRPDLVNIFTTEALVWGAYDGSEFMTGSDCYQ
jgi:hypothetical protein